MSNAPVFQPTRSKYLVFTTDYLLPLMIFLGILVLSYLTIYSSIFKIRKVDCILDYLPCTNPSLGAELDKLIGQNIFLLKPAIIESRLTSGDFTIRAAKLSRSLPGTLKLEMQSIYPVVALQIQGDSTWVVLDTRFRVIATRTEDPNVTTVIVKDPLTLTVGKAPTDSLITQTLALAIRLSDEISSIKTITLIDQDTLELALLSGKKVIFSPQKDELVQLNALQAILGSDTISKGVTTIDVRFSRPVLR
ncbi:MAG: hypothetical protein ABII21_03370 [bacterium]